MHTLCLASTQAYSCPLMERTCHDHSNTSCSVLKENAEGFLILGYQQTNQKSIHLETAAIVFSPRSMHFPPKMVVWRFFCSRDKKALLEREMSNLTLLNQTHLEEEEEDSTRPRLGHKSQEDRINTNWGGQLQIL